MRFTAFLTAIIVIFNFVQLNSVYVLAEVTKPTIESMSIDKREVTAGDTVKVSIKIKEYQDFRYLNLYYTSPITNKGITISLNFNDETKAFEGSIPISDYIESGNYKPHMLSLYGASITTIYSSEYDKFDDGEFLVNGTSGIELIESISVNKKEVTAGDTVKVSLKTSEHLGIRYLNSYFRSPISNQTLSVSLYYNPETDTFEGDIPISSITESGTYKLFMLNTYEDGNNTTAFYHSYYADVFQNGDFSVSGTNAANLIESINVSKKEVTGGETITFTVDSPELVGISYLNIYYSSPITNQTFSVDLYYNSETHLFEASYVVPDHFELGLYTLFMLAIYDTSGNTTAFYKSNFSDQFELGNFSFIDLPIEEPVAEYEFKSWESKFDVDVNKVWQVEYNLALDPSTIIEQNIYITDEEGNIVPIDRTTSHSAVQLAPVNAYEQGKTYILWIKDIKAKNGRLLQENVKMEFTISN
ncbi:hypothetical protein [Alkalihalobacillus deserti]|uniref:hypothetical protein n=1 Tax=Alkalihalobacillus deserti TaxID=2879466 RepID=UPI001D146F4A|nr:hypothetical protein [Alkalihalobacillus deserti]